MCVEPEGSYLARFSQHSLGHFTISYKTSSKSKDEEKKKKEEAVEEAEQKAQEGEKKEEMNVEKKELTSASPSFRAVNIFTKSGVSGIFIFVLL